MRNWSTALLIAFAVIIGWEYFWRSHGFKGQPNDDVGLWAVARAEASRNSETVVAFVGSSRTELAMNLDAFREVSYRRPIQLAIGGYDAFPVLRHLSEDNTFRGLVVCELIERDIAGMAQATPQSVPDEWISEYDRSNVFNKFEWQLQILSQRFLAFRLPGLAPRTLASYVRLWKLPPRPYIFVKQPRGFVGDYSLTDVVWHRSYLEEKVREDYSGQPAPAPERFIEGAVTLSKLADKLRSRGGRVVFLRPPSSGRIWEIENASYPRAMYWDAFATRVNAPTVHFKDYPELSRFECADGVHLDYRDAIPFTKGLVKVLADHQVLNTQQ